MSYIYIATILDNTNTGTYLQALALSKKIEDTKNKPVIIDYCRRHEKWHHKLWESLTNPRKPLYRKLLTIGNITLYTLIRRRLKHIIASSCKIMPVNQVLTKIDSSSILMTGSDQVWNNKYNRGIDDIYYLKFAQSSNKRVSYAASIGQDVLTPEEKHDMFSALKPYRMVSVREENAVSQLNEIGINAVQVLDPTLLLKHSEWLKTIPRSKFKKTEPYLLIYSVEWDKNSDLSNIAKQIADEKGLKVYAFSTDRKLSNLKCDRFFSFGTPQLFIDLFTQADFIIISSFHGTAFSINFNKQFLAVLPDKFGSRSHSLLNLFGLSNRVYDGHTPVWRDVIEYSAVNKKLETERAQSLHVLDRLVSE